MSAVKEMRGTKRSHCESSGQCAHGQCVGGRIQGHSSGQAEALKQLREATRSPPLVYPREDPQRGMGRFIPDGKTVGKFVSVDDHLSAQNFSQEDEDAERQDRAAKKDYEPVAFTDMTGRELAAARSHFPRAGYPYIITNHFMKHATLENLQLRFVNGKIRERMGPVRQGEREDWHTVAPARAAAEDVGDEDDEGRTITSEREGEGAQPIDGDATGD